MSKIIYNAVIYCRLSKEDGDKLESNSITGQKLFCEQYIAKQKDIRIIREPIIDDGVSGVSFNRDGFEEMLKDVKSGKVNCIVVRDLSRFSRNYIDAGKYIEKIFPELGVRFIAINDNYDSLNSDSQTDSFVIPFKNLINDSYCKDISVKVRSSLNVKQKNGDYVGSFCPYGYKRDGIKREKLIIDENVELVIKEIFSLYKDGYSIGVIAEKLNKRGVLTPMEYKKSIGINISSSFKIKHNSIWEYNTVKRILTNDCYIGILTQGKRGSPNYKDKRIKIKDENEWIKIENSHTPIISYEEFVSVNNLLLRDTRINLDNTINPLSGFIFCANCGSSMIKKTVTSKDKKYIYYVCSKNKKYKSCTSNSTSLIMLEEIVLNSIRDQVDVVVNLESSLMNLKSTKGIDENEYKYKKEIGILEEEVIKTKKLQLRIYEDYIEEIISKEEYFDFKQIYSNKLTTVLENINHIEKEFSKSIVCNTSESAWVKLFKKYGNIELLDRRVLLALIDKVFVSKNKGIEIIYKYRDEYLITKEFIENNVCK